MLITEYRIPFPASVDEYKVGMYYLIHESTSSEAHKNAGDYAVEIVRNERFFDNAHGLESGMYTEKVFHVRNYLPRYIRPFVPDEKAIIVEKVRSLESERSE